jgi:purine-nucleoside phosphorylase
LEESVNKEIAAYKAEAAIILGSGLGHVADVAEIEQRIPYRDIPGFPIPSISGDPAELLLGRIGGKRVLILQRRIHAYEEGNPAVMMPVIQMLSDAQVSRLILTNAAGSLDVNIRPGRLMLITDHINYSGMNPLIGAAPDKTFVSMTGAYDERMLADLRKVSKDEAIPLTEGVYIWFSGPNFETPAEIRAAKILGADAVGMSTVPEVILARYFGVRVAALSAITNLGAGLEGTSPSHEETKHVAAKAAYNMAKLIEAYFRNCKDD